MKDDYIFYTIIDVNEKESDCIFYNYITGEKIRGKNSDVDLGDMRVAYIIKNTPYIRKYIENSCEFVNLISSENDISFYEEDFVDVCGNLFITSRRRGRKKHMRIYKYPRMDVLVDEKCTYAGGIMLDHNYYIYIDR